MSRVIADVQPTLEQPAAPAGVLERPISALTDSTPQALVPFCRQLHLGGFARALRPSWQGFGHPRRTLWRWSAPLAPGSSASNEPSAVPRQAASSHYSWPNLTPRFDPRAELRHSCAPHAPGHSRWPKWLRLPDRNWLRFVDRSQVALKTQGEENLKHLIHEQVGFFRQRKPYHQPAGTYVNPKWPPELARY